MKWMVLVLCLFLACGCVRNPSGVRMWNPSTWTSGSEGRQQEKAIANLEEKKLSALREAQKAVFEAVEALGMLAVSRAQQIALNATQTALALMDQASGSLPVDETAKLRARVKALMSENEAVRKQAERDTDAARARSESIAQELEKARAVLAEKDAALASAFKRENALANELRNERFIGWLWKIGLGSVALISLAGWVYIRYVAGGLPGALGKAMAWADRNEPAKAQIVREVVDPYLDRIEQAKIRKQRVKASEAVA